MMMKKKRGDKNRLVSLVFSMEKEHDEEKIKNATRQLSNMDFQLYPNEALRSQLRSIYEEYPWDKYYRTKRDKLPVRIFGVACFKTPEGKSACVAKITGKKYADGTEEKFAEPRDAVFLRAYIAGIDYQEIPTEDIEVVEKWTREDLVKIRDLEKDYPKIFLGRQGAMTVYLKWTIDNQ